MIVVDLLAIMKVYRNVQDYAPVGLLVSLAAFCHFLETRLARSG